MTPFDPTSSTPGIPNYHRASHSNTSWFQGQKRIATLRFDFTGLGETRGTFSETN